MEHIFELIAQHEAEATSPIMQFYMMSIDRQIRDQLSDPNLLQPTKRRINAVVRHQMQTHRQHCAQSEEAYVKRMMAEHPIVVGRRSGNLTDEANQTAASVDAGQQQRSESCRRSRINNKIKKAKVLYRHQFLSAHVAETAQRLEGLHDIIQRAETRLVRMGMSATTLRQIRDLYGVRDRHQPPSAEEVPQSPDYPSPELSFYSEAKTPPTERSISPPQSPAVD